MMYILRVSGTSDNQNDYWKSWWHVFKTKEEAEDASENLYYGMNREVILVYEEQEYKNLETVLKIYTEQKSVASIPLCSLKIHGDCECPDNMCTQMVNVFLAGGAIENNVHV